MIEPVQSRIQMRNSTFNIAMSLCCSLLLTNAGQLAAQEHDIEEVQRNLSIFSGILEDSLSLNETTGLFGMSLGGVESTYLYHQGAVLEIRSPLANRRNRMGLASLSSAMQSLQLRQNPFEAMRATSASSNATTQALSAAPVAAASDGIYQQMMERIANIDYSLVAQTAIQQATHSARALRALGELDDSAYDRLSTEIENMRDTVSINIAELRGIEREVRDQAGSSIEADSAVSEANRTNNSLAMRLDDLLQRIEPIQNQALSMAQDLKARSEQAEQDYALAWQADLVEFEVLLYETLCEYGGTLSVIPEDQNVSLILKDLGEDRGDSRRTDQVHVVSKADITSCGNGNFDDTELAERATRYSY